MCRHEVCVIVNASANTPNGLVEHVWESVVLPIITEREVYHFLFTHNLRRVVRIKRKQNNQA